ncbi:FAR-17a/AIG1-like protein [Tuber brumale]|nr:FAR-17a/AIG1-like protein [Tuber brumale]
MAGRPSQRIHSPSRGISLLVHFAGLISFSNSFDFLLKNPNEISKGYGWHFQFLTIIALSLATMTFVVGFLADLFLWQNAFIVKNWLAVGSSPLEVLISILYWGISAIDRDLVVPPDMRLDPFVDMGFHLFPALLLLIDVLLLSPPWAFTFLPALLIPSGIATGYWVWLEHCFSVNQNYPYPLFNVIEPKGRVAVFVCSAVMMMVCALGIGWGYGKVNGVGMAKEVEKKGA